MNSEVLLVVINFANDIMFDSENEEDEDLNVVVPKVKNFAEETVPQFQTLQFKQHFRLLPETFEKLLGYLLQVKTSEQNRLDGHQEIMVEKQLMITVWYLANMESLR